MLGRVKSLLWNERTRRLRLPWRLVALLVVLAVLGLGAGVVGSALTSVAITRPLVLSTAGGSTGQVAVAIGNVVSLAAQVAVTVGGVYLAGRFADRRWFRDFGFRLDRAWWLDLGFGLALGAALMTGIFLVCLVAGWVTVTGLFSVARPGFSFPYWFGWGFVTFVAVGVYEELLFRGHLVTNLAEGFRWFDRVGPRGAVGLATLVTSGLFGVAHAANPNASPASTVGIVLAAFMLAAGYVFTGELAIPIGIHVTWNFFQGIVYGFPVSGTSFGVSLLAVDRSGPALVTGGAFGPEAGLLGLVAAAIGLGLIAAWVRWREGTVGVDEAVTTPELRTSRTE